MRYYCTKCKEVVIPEKQDDEENDETYEYCPLCENDMYLVDLSLAEAPTPEPLPIYADTEDPPHWTILAAERERKHMQKENEAIANYHQHYEQNEQEAKKHYFQTFK